MKTYTAGTDSEKVKRVLLWWRDVTDRTTEVSIWPGPSGWGIGSVTLVKWPNNICHYGIINVKLGKGG